MGCWVAPIGSPIHTSMLPDGVALGSVEPESSPPHAASSRPSAHSAAPTFHAVCFIITPISLPGIALPLRCVPPVAHRRHPVGSLRQPGGSFGVLEAGEHVLVLLDPGAVRPDHTAAADPFVLRAGQSVHQSSTHRRE